MLKVRTREALLEESDFLFLFAVLLNTDLPTRNCLTIAAEKYPRFAPLCGHLDEKMSEGSIESSLYTAPDILSEFVPILISAGETSGIEVISQALFLAAELVEATADNLEFPMASMMEIIDYQILNLLLEEKVNSLKSLEVLARISKSTNARIWAHIADEMTKDKEKTLATCMASYPKEFPKFIIAMVSLLDNSEEKFTPSVFSRICHVLERPLFR